MAAAGARSSARPRQRRPRRGEPGPRRERPDPVDADARPREPLADHVRGLDPDPRPEVGAPGGSTSTSAIPPGASSSRVRRRSSAGAPPMPTLPSSSNAVCQRPAPGTAPNTSPGIAAPPRRRASCTATGERSTPSARLPARRSAARWRPGPHPRSSTGAAATASTAESAASARAEPALERQRLAASRRSTGPEPARRRPATEHVLRRGGQQPPIQQRSAGKGVRPPYGVSVPAEPNPGRGGGRNRGGSDPPWGGGHAARSSRAVRVAAKRVWGAVAATA